MQPSAVVHPQLAKPQARRLPASGSRFKAKEKVMAHEQYQSCIDACANCATACHHCATACLQDPDVAMMARCIALDIDCAAVCELAAGAMARGSDFAPSVCALCADVCDACGEECARHQAQHCQRCADACRICAEECRRMSQSVGSSSAVSRGSAAASH